MGQIKILKASAGSGKTFMLAYEYVKNVIMEPYCYKNILAVTFTKKATGEMKSRIMDELHNLTMKDGNRDFLDKLTVEESLNEEQIRTNASKALNLILHDYSNFSVMTIDSFFQKIVRSFIKELHLECDYTIDFNTNYLLKLAIDSLIRKSDDDKQLKVWIEAFIDSKIEDSKRADIKEEMSKLSVMVLNEQFDKSYFEKNRDQLILFFNELSDNDKSLRDEIKSIGASFLDYMSTNNIAIDDMPRKSTGVYAYMVKLSKGDISRCSPTVQQFVDIENKGWGKLRSDDCHSLHRLFTEGHHKVSENLSRLKSNEALLKSHRTFVLLADISRELHELCSRDNKMLLSNTNYLINKLVTNNDTPYIYEKIGSNYQIIMIDEFQDTSIGQWENFKPLLENSLAESSEDKSVVTLVGDIKQSIYRWRGGDWRILGEGINSSFYGCGISEETLAVNYRSREEVINFNNRLIRGCVDGFNLSLNNNLNKLREDGALTLDTVSEYQNMLEGAYQDMEQELPTKPKKGGYVEVIKYEADENLQRMVETIMDLQDRGYQANDIAILVRSKKSAKSISAFILDYKRTHSEECEKYCFDIIAAEGLLLNRSNVVKFIMSIYTLCSSVTPTLLALYNRHQARELTAEIPSEELQFFETIKDLPAIESFEKIISNYNLGEDQNNISYLQAFHSAIIDFSGSEVANASSLVDWWQTENERLFVSLPEGQNAITIETIHKSKGLQYNAVIIPYCNWGLSPSSRDNLFWATADNGEIELPNSNNSKFILPYSKLLEGSYFTKSYIKELILTSIENFNIFYVALTRAKSELYIMIPHESRGSGIDSFISETLDENLIFGEKESLNSKSKNKKTLYIDRYKHCDISDRITLHTESDKFYLDMESRDDEAASGIDARGKGILLHKLFEQTVDLKDLPENLEKLFISGYLSRKEVDKLKDICLEATENPLIKDWFNGSWEVRSESSIIIPSTGDINSLSTRRPDRVLIKEDSAIVIDYKFGAIRESHRRQMEYYKELLKLMGYKKINGYLWYINNNFIAEV